MRAVGEALQKARGRMSQKAAAAHWGVPLATLAALEQGVERDYQPHTLHQFDEALGRSTLDLYNGPDPGPERDDVLARLEAMDQLLRSEFADISAQLAVMSESVSASPVPLRFAVSWSRLDADQQRTLLDLAVQLAERRTG